MGMTPMMVRHLIRPAPPSYESQIVLPTRLLIAEMRKSHGDHAVPELTRGTPLSHSCWSTRQS
eukprot:5408129-Amphidinium_carterae.1